MERLLLSKELSAGAGRLFLDRYGQLIELSASGQIAMRQMLEAHLRRLEWDEWQFPARLYPFLSAVAFGRPIVVSRGVTTAMIADRVDAGETRFPAAPPSAERAIFRRGL